MAFIDSSQELYKSQYGFRKQMSTSLGIIELVEEITNSLDNHEATVGIFIDLKKAFDTVDHSILIEKLYHCGIRGTANKWSCSYLMNIYQYVTIKWYQFWLHECAMWSSPRIYFRANLIHTLYQRYVRCIYFVKTYFICGWYYFILFR